MARARCSDGSIASKSLDVGNREMDKSEIIEITHVFRKGLEIQKGLGMLPNRVRDFPSGCCGLTSELFGHYLNTQYGLQA